jgi:YfiH family protein
MTPHEQARSLAVLEAVRHGFFGRKGGVSQGLYATLNAGPGSRDDAAAVAENRARIARTLGADDLLSLHQVHSARAVRVDGPWLGVRPEADALVTTTPRLALTALSADCAPVLLADPAARVIGAAHAGWRGALGGVLEACVAEMARAGAEPSRIVAAIGPCIHQASYEVGPDFRAAFAAEDQDYFLPGAGDRLMFDLPGYCAARLACVGVARIETLPRDTYALREDYHSHRRNVHDGLADYGRNCAAIMLADV